jgi:hypothetical protein
MTEDWVTGWLFGITIFVVILYILVILAFTTDLDERKGQKKDPFLLRKKK